MKSTLPLLACMFLGACSVSEENFPDRFAAQWCAASKACSEDAYFDRWLQGTADCTAATSDDVRDRSYGNGEDACRFEEDAAAACLTRIQSASCPELASEDWYDACASAWDCVPVFSP